MKLWTVVMLFCAVLAHPPRLVEIAKKVNSMKTTWLANEAIPTRDFKQLIGVLEGGEKAPRRVYNAKGAFPESFDAAEQWPECKSIREIRDQSVCGSCWAFGAVEAATDRLCIASKGKIQDRLSEEDLLSCCPYCGFGCHGGFPTMAWRFFYEHGVTTGGEYGTTNWCNAYSFPKCIHHGTGPYPPCGDTQDTPTCVEKCQEGYPVEYEKDKHKFQDWYSIESNPNEMKYELMHNGPFEVSFKVYEDFLTYKSGIYQHVTGEMVGGHAVKLVGWGVEDGVEYWKIANSWNESWGEDGYFRIKMGECDIEESGVAALPAN